MYRIRIYATYEKTGTNKTWRNAIKVDRIRIHATYENTGTNKTWHNAILVDRIRIYATYEHTGPTKHDILWYRCTGYVFMQHMGPISTVTLAFVVFGVSQLRVTVCSIYTTFIIYIYVFFSNLTTTLTIKRALLSRYVSITCILAGNCTSFY